MPECEGTIRTALFWSQKSGIFPAPFYAMLLFNHSAIQAD